MKLEIKKLQVELSWLPGHANIKGNEYADLHVLAKEADQEVKDAEDFQVVVSFGDVKMAA